MLITDSGRVQQLQIESSSMQEDLIQELRGRLNGMLSGSALADVKGKLTSLEVEFAPGRRAVVLQVIQSLQSLVDANPALRTAPIASEISSREKTMAATIFAEVVKNLEMSKTILSQETPIIQIVDQSTLPLPKEKVSKLKSLIISGFLAAFLFILFLLGNKWLSTQLNA